MMKTELSKREPIWNPPGSAVNHAYKCEYMPIALSKRLLFSDFWSLFKKEFIFFFHSYLENTNLVNLRLLNRAVNMCWHWEIVPKFFSLLSKLLSNTLPACINSSIHPFYKNVLNRRCLADRIFSCQGSSDVQNNYLY